MEEIPPKEILDKSVKVTILNRAGQEINHFFMRGGSNLWVFLRKNGYPIGSACSGVGVCSACNVKIIPSAPDAISFKNEFEMDSLNRNGKSSDFRLACLSRIFQDVSVLSELW
jgi:ferredoxin